MEHRSWRIRLSEFQYVAVTLIVCVSAILCPACHRMQERHTRLNPAIVRIELFDDLATSPKYASAIALADRDLPGDEWMTHPLRSNISRGRRVEPIAHDILSEIAPKLKGMSVSNLIRSLKVVEDGSALPTNYIADAIYPQGNQMIISEFKSRPAQERRILLTLVEDWADIDTGIQGPPCAVQEIVQEVAPSEKEMQPR